MGSDRPTLADERGRCRVCGEPAWSVDETGPIHHCCLFLGHLCFYCRKAR